METKVVAAGAIGAGAGAIQTLVLRQYADPRYGSVITSLKGFGTPSSLAGMIGGSASLVLGLIGLSKDRTGRQRLADIYVEPAIDYGVTALSGGILSGVFPAISIGTTSMAPFVQQAYQPDMNTIRQLTAEVQRLAQENQQLKTQAPAITVTPVTEGMFLPGQPTTRAKQQFGFMQPGIAPQHLAGPLVPTRMYVPAQPTERAKSYGFMDGAATPIAAVQQMKAKYDFSG